MNSTNGRWFAQHRRELQQKINDPDLPYPCHFGAHAERKGDNWYEWLDFGDPDLRGAEVWRLAKRLDKFIQASRAAARGKRLTLLCTVGPPGFTCSLEEDRVIFWRLLARLRDIDHIPPPPSIPANPNHPEWRFSFAGDELFLFCLSPFYGRRHSRRLGHCLTVGFQSIRVFSGIEGDTEAGVKVKASIRARLIDYDDVPLIEALGDGKSRYMHEWKGYFPAEDGALDQGRCPLADEDTISAPAIQVRAHCI